MGKTAVALAAALQSRRTIGAAHAGQPANAAPGSWADSLLYDGHDGHPGHLYRGGTLVIAPKTLLPQVAALWSAAVQLQLPMKCFCDSL
jgi:hypothetical protein